MPEPFILWFKDINLSDLDQVGGKNAALGEMFQRLRPRGVNLPDGFAITAAAYRRFLRSAGLDKKIKTLLAGLQTNQLADLQKRARAVRRLLLETPLPEDLSQEILSNYKKLGEIYFSCPDVAVRSSATVEDLPGASFAGQQETYLNVRGEAALLDSVRKCFASLFTARAISYRSDKGFDQTAISLSVAVQKMVRTDKGVSGVMFTLDTESGFTGVVVINASYGLGEMVVQGAVIPDEYTVFKPLLAANRPAIISRNLGRKDVKMIYHEKGGGVKVTVPVQEREKYCLTEEEVLRLACWGVEIEKYFSGKHGRYQPMDIEWGKDGETGELFVLQARPETVHSLSHSRVIKEYKLEKPGRVLARGAAVGTKIAAGPARRIKSAKFISQFKKGEVLVTDITDPDWEPIMKIASAIVTNRGGRTSHAAIVSRELGIPCVVGTGLATKVIKTGSLITVDCSSGREGVVYAGKLPFAIREHELARLPETKTQVLVNIGTPDEAFRRQALPVAGVGLGRLEFIISSQIKIHPNALLDYERLARSKKSADQRLAKQIDALTKGYSDKTLFYVDELAEGIAKIAAAFWPRPVLIRFSDFKTNEYRSLLGGERYEPAEENPLLGWRGASRYNHPDFEEAFGLEVKAIKKVRGILGLVNVIPMVPFCRTVEEGRRVLAAMKRFGLDRARDPELKIYMMCEIPSNIILVEEFLDLFDGYSIGSNDLAMLTLGLDRDSAFLATVANENNEAVKKIITQVIKIARGRGKPIGICGQAPSDYADFLAFLVQAGITSLSLNPDSVIPMIHKVAQAEKFLVKENPLRP